MIDFISWSMGLWGWEVETWRKSFLEPISIWNSVIKACLCTCRVYKALWFYKHWYSDTNCPFLSYSQDELNIYLGVCFQLKFFSKNKWHWGVRGDMAHWLSIEDKLLILISFSSNNHRRHPCVAACVRLWPAVWNRKGHSLKSLILSSPDYLFTPVGYNELSQR